MDLKQMLQIAVWCMEAIGFLSMIFQWRRIRDMDLKPMLQIAMERNALNDFWIRDNGKDGRFPGGERAVEDVLTGLANEREIE
jgi:hypothetical protein